MFLRLYKALPNVSIFHHAKSAPSQRALNVLRNAIAQGYPQGKPLEFDLEVVESTPTPDQISLISSYASKPLSSFLSSHPSAADTASSSSTPDTLHQALAGNPMAMKYPIVVDWENGRAVVGDSGEADAVKSVILEGLRKARDGQ